jgi:hypothetical protein
MPPRPGHERFTRPAQPNQRRYEALRAYFVEGASAQEVAERLGYTRASVESGGQVRFSVLEPGEVAPSRDGNPNLLQVPWVVSPPG